MKTENNSEFVIDSKNLNYRDLNLKIKNFLNNKASGTKTCQGESYGISDKKVISITLENVLGQRYIGDGINTDVKIKIYGTPGNDLAAFMDGPEIEVFGSGQDGIGNTMNSGIIIIHGDCGDIVGYSMRGGEIYIEGNVGYRSGIHMKSYMEKCPVIVIGGRAGNFLGEYMAGGIIIVLGINKNKMDNPDLNNVSSRIFSILNNKSITGDYTGAGMHGGTIYIRGEVENYKLGKEVKINKVDEKDKKTLDKYILNFCRYFNADSSKILSRNYKDFIKLTPYSHRPYGKLYAY